MLVENEALLAASRIVGLRDLGFEVVWVVSGEKAIIQLKRETNIDIVLMDIELGNDMNGIDAAARIAIDDSRPVVFVANATAEAYAVETATLSPVRIIPKYISNHFLSCILDFACQHSRASRILELPSSEFKYRFEKTEVPLITLDLNYAVELFRQTQMAPTAGGFSIKEAVRLLDKIAESILVLSANRLLLSFCTPRDISELTGCIQYLLRDSAFKRNIARCSADIANGLRSDRLFLSGEILYGRRIDAEVLWRLVKEGKRTILRLALIQCQKCVQGFITEPGANLDSVRRAPLERRVC